MSIGFRKSLFGFHCDDVLNYIEKLNNKHEIAEKELNYNIEELNREKDSLNKQLDDLRAEISSLNDELAGHIAKADEIRVLSEGIGRLYLVSQTQAKALIDSANACSKAAMDEVNKNLETLDNAHGMLGELKSKAVADTNRFSGDLDDLLSSLESVKSTIREQAVLPNEEKETVAQTAN